MKILLVTRDFPPRINGGVSTAVGNQAAALAAAGHSCAVVSFDGWRSVSPRQRDPNVDVTAGSTDQIAVFRLSYPTDLDEAFKFACASCPDVIHMQHSMLLDFAQRVALEVGAPLVKTIHVLQHQMNTLRRMDKPTLSLDTQIQTLAAAAAVIAPSQVTARLTAVQYPEIKGKIRVVCPCIPDTALAAAANRQRTGKLVLSAGRFNDIKGTSELFSIARTLVTRDAQIRIVIAGGNPDGQKCERRFMRRWAADGAGLDVSGVLFPGWLSPEELGTMYADASVFVAPSLFETFGQSIAEAMLHGTPAVAFKCGGPEEIIEHEKTGILVEPGNIDAFCDAVAGLLDDPIRRAAMGAAARQSILERFGPDEHAAALIKIYQQVTGKP